MRTVLLVIFSAVLLAGLFIGYWTLQPTSPAASIAASTHSIVPPPPKRNDPELASVHSGKRPWLKQHNDLGLVTSEFRGDEYHPKPNGTVDVVNPIGRFFLGNHQRLEICGKTGNVLLKNVSDPIQNGLTGAAAVPAPPSHGRLEDVTVTLIDETRPADKQAVLVMKTNNVYFENETALIFTQSYRDEQGRLIERDQVPVHVTGDIDMEGRGLRARWNDRDGRLEEFEIAHGDVLIIKDPSHLSLSGEQKQSKPKSAPLAFLPFSLPRYSGGGLGRGPIEPPLPLMLASQDKKAAGEVITTFKRPATQPHARPARESTGPAIYRARFYDNVRINQPDASEKFDQLLIDNVSQMDVEFLTKQSSPEEPSRASASQPASPAAPTVPATPATNAPAQAVPATQPVAKEQPIYIHWTGMLRMTPLQSAPTVPLKAGDSSVKLIGAPAHVHRIAPNQQGTDDITCDSIVYATAGEKAWLYRSQRFPQVLINKYPPASAKDQTATHLVSSGIVEYSRGDQRAIANGTGRAEIPLESSDPSQHPLMHTAWKDRALFTFAPGAASDQLVLRSGHLEGAVDVEHPRMNLRGQILDLSFGSINKPQPLVGASAAPAQQPNQTTLRQMIATTDVYCQLIDAQGKSQIIESNRLLLDTDQSEGKIYAHHLNATGHVHAYADDDLQADNLDVLLRPAKPAPNAKVAQATTRKAGDDAAQVELQEMVAWGNVTTKSKDGSVAMGDKLTVTANNGKQHAILTSAAQAKVINASFDYVTGPEIQFDSGDGKAYVIGQGMLHAIKQASTTQPAEPVDVAWTTGAQFDGAANRIDADGGITMRALRADGSVETGTGDHILVDLQKKPLPEMTAEPIVAAATQPKSKNPNDANGVNMDLFKDKQLVAFTLTGNANLDSTLKASDGSIAQQMVLRAAKVIMRRINPDGTESDTLTVPVAGRMLVRDHRKVQSSQSSDASSNGMTGFEWSRSLVYSKAARRADMAGQVVIRHFGEDPQQLPVEVNGEHVIAYFERPAAQPAKNRGAKLASEDDSHMQLKHVTVLAGPNDFVVVKRGDDLMQASQIDYDPIHHVLTAIAMPRNPVYFARGTTFTTADRVDWDTITWNPHFVNPIMTHAPPAPGVQSAKPKVQPPDWQKQNNRKDQ